MTEQPIDGDPITSQPADTETTVTWGPTEQPEPEPEPEPEPVVVEPEQPEQPEPEQPATE